MPDKDDQLDLNKKRARRRLVGAAALALAAAIVLPMVMDERPRSDANELQIRIPSQEGGNYTARLITAKPEPVAETSIADPVPVVAQSAVPGAESAPVAAVAAKPETRELPLIPPPPPPRDVKAEEAARALALLEGRDVKAAAAKPAMATSETKEPAASKPNAAEQQFYVQVGVYRDAENVRSVKSTLKSIGFSAVTEKTGDRTRVKVGPYPNRQSADAAAAKLKKAGMSVVVQSAG